VKYLREFGSDRGAGRGAAAVDRVFVAYTDDVSLAASAPVGKVHAAEHVVSAEVAPAARLHVTPSTSTLP
jgi:hypothetical protein